MFLALTLFPHLGQKATPFLISSPHLLQYMLTFTSIFFILKSHFSNNFPIVKICNTRHITVFVIFNFSNTITIFRVEFYSGIDVFTTGEIGKERKEMVIKSMKVFSQLMEIYGVEHYRACATSAMRDAKNGKEIIDLVKKESGIQIEIISGDEEATLIYENHVAEGLDKNFGYLYIDVGGGSTELTYYENGKMKYKHSFNIGTIRLLNNLVTKENWEEMKTEIKTKIVSKKPMVAIGSGGNINKIFSMSKTKDGKPMSANMLKTF